MRYQLQVQELEYKNQKTRLRPKFSLVAGTTQDEQSYGISDPKYQVNSLYAGASVTWAIFDGFASQAGVRSALAHRRQTENDYHELTARLIQQAHDDRKQLYFSARNMSLDDRYLKASDAAVTTRRDDFTRGVGSESDISLAQLSAYDARLACYNQRIDFMVKVSGLMGLVNEDPVLEYAPAK
jgi:outer membrane protein TolC